jgi:CRP-like cAMP-binding protein
MPSVYAFHFALSSGFLFVERLPMPEPNLPETLRAIELFHGLSDEQCAAISAISTRHAFSADTVILEQGAPGDSLYIISEGQVEVSIRDATGGTRTYLYLGPGQIVGEFALLDGGQRSATIRADQDGTMLFRIDRAPFLLLCEQDTRLGYVVMRNLALDLAFKGRHRNAGVDA